jgi:uncharacterized protein (TIGR03084 family)
MGLNLNDLIDDLAAEQAALEAVLIRLVPEDWDRPTHAPGWAVRDQVAHLASFDELAGAIITSSEDLFAKRRGSGAPEPSFLERGRAMTPKQVLAWWQGASRDLITAARTVDPARRLPWGRDMSPASFLTARLMETWSHGLDVVDVVAPERPDSDRLRHVAQLGVSTRSHSYAAQGRTMPSDPMWVDLVLPSGVPWSWGEPGAENRVSGSATDFCRVVTRRRHVADTGLKVQGPAAEEWMLIAQAFAGPPGDGRQPGEFAHERQG